MPARKSHSEERTARTSFVERAQALISDDPIIVRAIIARFDGCSEGWNCGVRKVICFSVEWCTDSYESFDSKLALRQRRYVLIQVLIQFCPPNSPDLNPLDYYVQ